VHSRPAAVFSPPQVLCNVYPEHTPPSAANTGGAARERENTNTMLSTFKKLFFAKNISTLKSTSYFGKNLQIGKAFRGLGALFSIQRVTTSETLPDIINPHVQARHTPAYIYTR